MRYAIALALSLFAAPATAAYTDGGSPLNLHIPALGDSGNSWASSVRYNFMKISTGAVLASSTAWPTFGRITVTTFTAINGTGFYFSSGPVTMVGGGGLTVAYGSDVGSSTVRGQETVVGTATVRGNAFSVGGSSFSVSGGSVTVAYSMTATAFIGSGAGLTNLPAGVGTPMTVQVLTSGTGATYTRPSGPAPVQIKVYMVGGGGGGGASATNAGATGGTTSFNSITVIGGTGGGPGIATGDGSVAGAVGGTGGSGSCDIRIAGGGGMAGMYGQASPSPMGGASFLGLPANGQIRGSAPSNAPANSGAGGTGGAGVNQTGAGGGGGEFCLLTINSPGSSYTYTVGAGGAGGSAGTVAGANGGSGVIIVYEYY